MNSCTGGVPWPGWRLGPSGPSRPDRGWLVGGEGPQEVGQIRLAGQGEGLWEVGWPSRGRDCGRLDSHKRLVVGVH